MPVYYDGGPSPEDVLRDVTELLAGGGCTDHERRVAARHMALAVEYYREVVDQRRNAPREPGKDEL